MAASPLISNSFPNTDSMNLAQLLKYAAGTQGGIFFYPSAGSEFRMEYHELLHKAQIRARAIQKVPGLQNNSVILLHFDQQLDNIEWFWAVTVAGYLPTLSTPLVNDPEQRKKHLSHLYDVLLDPIVFTKDSFLLEFKDVDGLRVHSIESVDARMPEAGFDDIEKLKIPNGRYMPVKPYQSPPTSIYEGDATSDSSASISGSVFSKVGSAGYLDTESSDHQASDTYKNIKKNDSNPFAGLLKKESDIAALMLTSGSTGNAKAVSLRHGQLLQSVKSKAGYHNCDGNHIFLSWIGMDHVANLVEIHLHALSLGADQVQVQAADVSATPLRLLELIDKHRVSYTFCPNFFLAKLLQTLPGTTLAYDLSSLDKLISGGEANVVATGVTLADRLKSCYLLPHAIRPGFGMTETCAGCIYSNDFPTSDIARNVEFAALGFPIPTLEMRVVTDTNDPAKDQEVGNLQLRGPIIFQEYFNNPSATKETFTEDGWFRTGDRAYLDSGRINLAGRTKETIIINGVNYYPHEIEVALEESYLPGVIPSYCAVFAHRPKGSETETYVVIYAPAYDPEDAEARSDTQTSIARLSALFTASKPFEIVPLSVSVLPKSSLGKLSRLKLRSAFESGIYSSIQNENNQIVRRYKISKRQAPANEIERLVLEECALMFQHPVEEVSVDSSVFDLGASSIDLFVLRTRLQARFSIPDIPMASLLINPTIGAIALFLRQPKSDTYDPVVPLQKAGDKTPLWFVHPGSGDVLVFVAIIKYFPDRPVFALRTRGFNPGEVYFSTIHEAAGTYYAHIKKHQPQGPYALGGYSLGSTLAYELAKLLEYNGDEVKFLGLFDSPPHICPLVAHTDWVAVALNVAYFLELVPEEFANELVVGMCQVPQDQVVDLILKHAPSGRVEELTIDNKRLTQIVEVTTAFRLAALQYTCEGQVQCMDVFFATPLQAVSPSREDWLINFLKDWLPFCRTEVRFYECAGKHASMFNEPHTFDLQKRLKLVLKERGL